MCAPAGSAGLECSEHSEWSEHCSSIFVTSSRVARDGHTAVFFVSNSTDSRAPARAPAARSAARENNT